MTINPEVLAEFDEWMDFILAEYPSGQKNWQIIRAELLAMDARLANPCAWTQDEWDGSWDTACDNKHQFTDGSPADNNHAFCPYCGGTLETADAAIDAMHNSAREAGE